jgi:hypothetical protein
MSASSQITVCRASGSHGGEYEDDCPVRYLRRVVWLKFTDVSEVFTLPFSGRNIPQGSNIQQLVVLKISRIYIITFATELDVFGRDNEVFLFKYGT